MKVQIKEKSMMCLSLFLFIGLFEVKSQSNTIFEEVNGLVSVEAEHFSDQKFTDKRKWYLTTDAQSSSNENQGNFASSASGNAFMEIRPDTRRSHADLLIQGENFSNVPGVLALIQYKVHFNLSGRYYVWVRCYSNNSEDNGVHVGIDGLWPESGQRMQWCEGKNEWRWQSAQRTNEVHCGVPGLIYIDIPTPGIHTIVFSQREDGFRIDKWLMTTDPDFIRPSDAGPAEKIFRKEIK